MKFTALSALLFAGLAPAVRAATPADIIATHPRVYMNAGQLQAVKNRVAAGDADFTAIKAYADRRLADPAGAETTLRSAYPVRVAEPMFFVAAVTGNAAYINGARSYLNILLSIPASQGTDTDQRERIVCFYTGYDWLHSLLTAAEKKSIRDSLYSHVQSISGGWNETDYVSGHGRWATVVTLNACIAVRGEDARFDAIMDTVYAHWTQGFNPVAKYVRRGGGHHMGWAYGGAYSSADAEMAWFSATGELWLDSVLHETAFRFIYADNGSGALPEYGDAYFNDVGTKPNSDLLSLSAGLMGNGYAEGYYRRNTAKFWEPSRVMRIISKNSAVTPLQPAGLPLARHFQNSGFVVARESWDSGSAILTFKSTPFYSYNHHHRDQNSFVLNYKGPLLINAGHYDAYGSVHFRNYYSRTIAHNSLVVLDPGEAIPKSGHTNDGGQRLEPWDREPKTIADLLGRNALEGVEKFSQNSKGAWTRGNASSAYHTAKLTSYLRDLVFARSIGAWVHPVIFVVDRVTLPVARTPRILWQTGEVPSLNAGYALVNNAGGGHARLEFLKPGNRVVNVVGDNESRWTVNDSVYAPTAENGGVKTWGRMEVAPPAPVTSQTFVTLISIGDQGVTPAALPVAQLLEGASWTGARLLNTFFVLLTGPGDSVVLTAGQGGGLNEGFISGAASRATVRVIIGGVPHFLTADSAGFVAGPLLPATGTDSRALGNAPGRTVLTCSPNPFRDAVCLSFGKSRAPVELLIFDVRGKQVFREFLKPGTGGMTWRPGPKFSGVFIVKAVLGNTVQVKTLLRLQ